MASLVLEFSVTIKSFSATVASIPHSDLSLSQYTLVHRVTSVLNGNNFLVWSHSFHLFLGENGKTGWILGHHPKLAPTHLQWDINNCTILGWLFNSIKDMIYHMLIYNDTIQCLWIALS